MLKFYRIILSNREIFVMGETKGLATITAMELGKLDKLDLYDVEDILEITERDYNFGIGRRRGGDESWKQTFNPLVEDLAWKIGSDYLSFV